MSNEGLVLDGLALNDENPWRILDGTFQFTPAKKKLNWAGSALADGSALVGDKDHYENAEMVFRLRMEAQNSPDTAQSLLNDLTTKLQKGRDIRGGLPLTWTPANSGNTQTLYMLDAEYDELPSSYEEGWTTQAYQLVVHLYLRPFIYGFEQSLALGTSDQFAFDSITNGRWRFDSGSGTVAISNDALIPSSTSNKRLYLSFTTSDVSLYTRARIGSTISGQTGVIARRIDASNQLRMIYGSSSLVIQKLDAGVSTSLATQAWTPTALTPYWLNASVVGNDITLSVYSSSQPPLTYSNPTPLASVSYTLTGANATKFGDGVRGNVGIHLTPAGTSTEWYITDFVGRGMTDITGSDPILGFEIPQVVGQVDAEGRLVITEGSSQDRAHIEWGLEARNYDPTVVWPQLIDSDSMLTASFAGAQGTAGLGAYDPNASGTDSIQVTNISETVPLTVCSFGSQKHVGAFKVKARVLGTADVKCRLSWRIGDGQPQRNDFCPPLLGVAWQEIDLGTIIVPETAIGNQSWTGRLEAVGVSGGGLTLDYVEVIPLERYGVARAPLRPITPTVYSAFDNFNQTAGALGGPPAKTLTSGQLWATSGATGDFSVVAGTSHNAQRTATGDVSLVTGRYAVAGSTNYAGVQVQADVGTATALSNAVDLTALLRMGVLLRYNDANNWLMAVRQVASVLKPGSFGGPDTYIHTTRLILIKRVASVNTTLGNVAEQVAPEIHRTIICQVDGAGVYQVYSFWPGTNQPAEPQIVGQDAVLSTGAALQDGKIGLYDVNTAAAAATRTYDNFTAFDSQTSVVMYSGRSMEVRADRTERESSSGSQWGRVPMYRGDRLLIPPTGDSGQVARMAVKARRNDVDGGLPDNQIADTITVAAFATPRYLVPS